MFHATFEMFCINVVYIYIPCTGRGLFKVSFVCLLILVGLFNRSLLTYVCVYAQGWKEEVTKCTCTRELATGRCVCVCVCVSVCACVCERESAHCARG